MKNMEKPIKIDAFFKKTPRKGKTFFSDMANRKQIELLVLNNIDGVEIQAYDCDNQEYVDASPEALLKGGFNNCKVRLAPGCSFVKFSHHLFTDPKSTIPILMSNAGGRDERPICFKRYHTSFAAVELVKQMGKSIKQFHFAKNDNFLVLKAPVSSLIKTKKRENESLHVFFRLRKYKKIEGWIEIYVESSYIAPKEKGVQHTSMYMALEHFVLTGQRLKEPPKHFGRR